MTYLSDALLVKGEPTGITGLDELLGGGCRLGEVTAWHAEAKTGKNTVWHKLMHLWLKRGIPLGYASRELTPATEVLPDLLSIELQRSIRKTAITASEIQTAIQSWPLYFSSGYGAWEWEDIYEWVIALKALGVKYFWFDHLHYMIDDPEDYGQASKLIKRLKTLAKSESIYINVIIQPNKLAEGQKLSLNSIKGGAAMGQAIDNLITLERVKDQKNILRLELKAARSKMATLGERYLQYNPETIDFIEVAPTQADSQSHKILHEDY